MLTGSEQNCTPYRTESDAGPSRRTMLYYGIGDFALQLLMNTCGIYLLYFFTDVFIIPAGIAGVILLSSRLAQGFLNPLIGFWSDRMETAWGKKRPFLLFGCVPSGLLFFLLFASPNLTKDIRVIYEFIISILFFFSLSLIAIPYNSLTAVLTNDSKTRARLSAYRMPFAILGTLAAAGATKQLVAIWPEEGTGFRMVAAAYAGIMITFILITFSKVKEKIRGYEDKEKHFLKDLRILLQNRPFLVITTATFSLMLATNIMAAVILYFLKYNLNSEWMIPIAFLSFYIASLASTPLFLRISHRRSKRYAFNLGLGIFAAVLMIAFFIAEAGTHVFILLLVAAGIGGASTSLGPWSMVPDTVEYSEWKFGIRNEGMTYGMFILFLNLSAALAGLIVGFGLEVSGYIPNSTQNPETLISIRLMMSLLPAALIMISMVVMIFYTLDAAMHKQMVDTIHDRQERVGAGNSKTLFKNTL
jgi:sugar (glycoside-pentoside-hexuronide) transporter